MVGGVEAFHVICSRFYGQMEWKIGSREILHGTFWVMMHCAFFVFEHDGSLIFFVSRMTNMTAVVTQGLRRL